MNINNDTIIAQSTAIGLSGIGVIRISGPLSKFISKKILGCIPEPRYAKYTKFKNSKDEIIDIGIAIFFNKPNSYTGEDVLELHTHGNQIILDIIIQDIISLSTDIRYAKSGEFTKRAVLNNKLDLIQAEAINDIIHANSELSIKYAVNNLKGNFSVIFQNYFTQLLNIKKYVEHFISFENDDDVKYNILNPLQYLISQIDDFILNIKKKSPIVKGFKLVITGKPNVGKSSLFNAMLGYERAIVTDLKGTTRDVISEFMYLNKTLPIYLIDTAGIRKNVLNKVEKKGVELTMQQLKEADVIIYIIEYNKPFDIDMEINTALNVINRINIPIIFVINKIDKEKTLLSKKVILNNTYNCIFLSAKQHKLNLLLSTIQEVLNKKYIYNSNKKYNFLANDRQINYISKINQHLKQLKKIIIKNKGCITDICGEELYMAEKAFDELFGKKTEINNLLNDIFNTFCIGK